MFGVRPAIGKASAEYDDLLRLLPLRSAVQGVAALCEGDAMSRGLSQQQRRILGFGYAFNAELHGGLYRQWDGIVPAGDRYRDEYRGLPVSEGKHAPDFTPWMLPHFVGGVPMHRSGHRYQHAGNVKSIRVSLSRATTGLWRRKLIAYHDPGYGWWECHSGYILTAEGTEVGAEYAVEFANLVERVASGLYWSRHADSLRAEAETNRYQYPRPEFSVTDNGYRRGTNSLPVTINGYQRDGADLSVTVTESLMRDSVTDSGVLP